MQSKSWIGLCHVLDLDIPPDKVSISFGYFTCQKALVATVIVVIAM